MYSLYACLTGEHDLRLVGVAVLLCALSSMAGVTNARRAIVARKSIRLQWILSAGVMTGVGVWGTHYVSMMAYQTPVAVSYNLVGTIASLIVAIGISACAWGYATSIRAWHGAPVGGAVLGAGIACMHYLGMASMDADAVRVWDAGFVLISIGAGVIFGAASTSIALRIRDVKANFAASGLLVLAVGSMHFLAMTALTLVPLSPAVPVVGSPPSLLLGLTVTLGVLAVVVLGLALAIFDYYLGDRREAEQRQIRALADATFEGLIIVRNGVMRDMNSRLPEMLQLSREDLVGMPLSKIALTPDAANALHEAGETTPMRAQLRCRDGGVITVQILAREVEFDGVPERVVAVRDVSLEERTQARVEFMAHHDALTGLPNRVRFREGLEQELKRAWEAGTEVAVMVFDLDRFKEVNDVHGHAVGDTLLVKVAERFLDALPRHALAARLSGDEFAVVLPDCTGGRSQAVGLAQRVVNSIGSPLDIENIHLNVSASGGVTMFPLDGEDPDRLMNQADLALYRAKGEGRNCVSDFDPQLGLLMQERRMLEADLSEAIDADLLDLHFQPQVRLGSGDIVGYEALVRWNDARRGYVPPPEFVQIAEETGQILKMGAWVIEQACREAVAWPDDRRVSVNVSPAQFKQGNLVVTIEQALKTTGLDPARLEVEVTEGVLIDDEARALTLLRHLKKLGVSIAIDDFGTGYASLNYLRAFPFDVVKIDRAFVTGIQNDPEAQIIVRATIDLAQDLGMATVIEGVESFDELIALGEQPDLVLQGYLLSKPLTRGQLSSFDAETENLRAQIRECASGRSVTAPPEQQTRSA